MPLNYYHILGIPSNASLSEIKTAYKQLAKKHHPDKNAGNINAEEQFKIINEAYQTLSNPEKKRLYDNKHYLNHQNSDGHRYKYQTSYTTNYHRNFDFGKYQPKENTTAYSKPINPQKGNIKFYILAFVFILVIGSIGLTLGYFMNNYAAKEHLKVANDFLKIKEYEQASSEYEAAIHFNDELSDAYFGKGIVIMEAMHDFNKAIIYFNAAINLSETPNPYYFEKRAFCFYQIENYDKAILDMNIAIKNPKFQTGENYYFRGMCQIKLGMEKESCSDFQLALKRNFQHAEEKIIQFCY